MSTIRYCIGIVCLVMLSGVAGATLLPPVANFTANVTAGTAPLPVKFTDNSLYATGWAWFFGDETFRGPWTLVNASSGWSKRFGHSSVVLPDGSIVLTGGSEGDFSLRNDTWRSTDNGTTWTLMNASSGWSARQYHSSVAMPDGSIVLMGGAEFGNYKNDTWQSIDKGATWTLVNASAEWAARGIFSTVVMPDGSIVLMGGAYDINHAWGKNDTWRSTDGGDTWTEMNASSGWEARYGHSSVVMPDGSIVLISGYGETSGHVSDIWRSTDNGAMWIRVTANPGWSARERHTSVVMPDGSIVLMGGYGDPDGFKNDTWRSTDNGAQWLPVNVRPDWGARSEFSSVVMKDGSIVLMGGVYDNSVIPYRVRNDTWRLQPVGSSEQNPVHIYTAPGNYTVSLQAYNPGHYNKTRKAGYITVIPAITVVVPNGGANWKQGSAQIIRWSYSGSPGSKVKIELLKGTAVNRLINTSTSIGSGGSGSYSWNVPYNQVLGTDYKIRITSTSNAAYTDKSNANFTISAGAPITVVVPNGGANWKQGSAQIIRWSYSGSPGSKVKIELLKGTAVNRLINASTSIGSGGLGSYSWNVPYNQVLGTDYKIRITSTSNAAYTDKSNANFTISAGAPITVVVPNGGENWKRGFSHTIKWSYTGSPGSKVKIALLKGTAVNRVINASTSIGSAGSGSYSWKIPSNQTLGTDFRIRITSTTNAAKTDKSNANFTISV